MLILIVRDTLQELLSWLVSVLQEDKSSEGTDRTPADKSIHKPGLDLSSVVKGTGLDGKDTNNVHCSGRYRSSPKAYPGALGRGRPRSWIPQT